MEKCLITGNLGFIGHHLAKKLTGMGHYTIGVDNGSNGDRKYKDLVDEYIWDDVSGITAETLQGVDWVFHLAALPRVPYSIEHPSETHEANVNQTLSLLIAAKNAGVKKVIFSSSSSVYGSQGEFPTKETARTIPLSPYAAQKLAAETYCEVFRKVYGLPTVSLRYFNVYGEEQRADNPYTGVITIFKELAKNRKPLTIHGDGTQLRDFTYVQDVVAANILAAKSGEGIYNVGSGETTSIGALARMISDDINYGPPRVGDPPKSLANNDKLRILGWSPKMKLKKWLT